MYARVPKYNKNGDIQQKRHNTNPVESWNAAMIEDCKTNRNSSALTLMEMLVKFFTKQSMNIELAIHGQGKFDLVSHIPPLLWDRMETALSDVVWVRVVNFLHHSKASSIAAFAFAGK